MKRYFFPIKGENLTFDDESGQSFPTVRDATVHPAEVAGELAEDRNGGVYEDCTVCLLDETGAEVTWVPTGTMT